MSKSIVLCFFFFVLFYYYDYLLLYIIIEIFHFISSVCRFSVELDLNYLRKTANASIYGLSGATHIEDMLYLFKMNVFVTDDAYEHILDDSLEGQMIRNFSKFIVNFVNNGYTRKHRNTCFSAIFT